MAKRILPVRTYAQTGIKAVGGDGGNARRVSINISRQSGPFQQPAITVTAREAPYDERGNEGVTATVRDVIPSSRRGIASSKAAAIDALPRVTARGAVIR